LCGGSDLYGTVNLGSRYEVIGASYRVDVAPGCIYSGLA
jgi:hypothetical protein